MTENKNIEKNTVLNEGNSYEIVLPENLKETYQLPDPSLLQFYEDVNTRTIWFTEEIDSNSLEIISRILRWNREDEQIPIEKRKPIKILFFSPGGSLDVEETLVSVIMLSKTPIYGIALGMVASAASVVYLSCSKRYALKNAYFLLHRGSCNNISGNFNEIVALLEDYKIQVEQMIDFYIEHTGYTEEEILNNIDTDWYVRGDELIEKGIVQEWITDINILL